MNNIHISILCPSRGRPKNLERLIASAIENANKPDEIEFLFYIDDDDATFIDFDYEKYIELNCRIIRGKRMWISVAHNFLYSQANGEIIMAAADDFVFKTKNWDALVSDAFFNSIDNLILVYGSDLGSYKDTLAIYGFFHRDWIETVGYWTYPARGSLYDLWSFEVAKELGRLVYLPNLEIAHVHYRQGEATANFDNTYRDIYNSNSTWRPAITYKQLKRERRIDLILLCEKAQIKVPIDVKYVLAHIIVNLLKINVSKDKKRRLLSMQNKEIIIGAFKLNHWKVFRH